MHGRTVLVTGGTGGLGRAVTRLFAERGADVVVPVFAPAERPALQAALGELAARVRFVDADLRDEPGVEALVAGLPRLDALVHLVGGFAMGPVEDCDLATARQQLELNVTVAFLAIKHAVRRMKAAGYGRIVTVGSRSAVQPAAGQAIYSASKAGVVALTQAVAAELSGTDVTANCVLPSIIDTPANRAAMGEANADRWVKPESLAEVICFLASEAARDVRGAAVPVYGSA